VWHDATSRSDECGGERASQHASGRVLDDRETMLCETRLADVHTCTCQAVLTIGTYAYRHMPSGVSHGDICGTIWWAINTHQSLVCVIALSREEE
jgi:hypothetical protein